MLFALPLCYLHSHYPIFILLRPYYPYPNFFSFTIFVFTCKEVGHNCRMCPKGKKKNLTSASPFLNLRNCFLIYFSYSYFNFNFADFFMSTIEVPLHHLDTRSCYAFVAIY